MAKDFFEIEHIDVDSALLKQAETFPVPELLYSSAISGPTNGRTWPHFHHCMELMLITGGSGQFFFKKDFFEMEPGDLVIIPESSLHTEKSDEFKGLDYRVIALDGITFSGLEDDKIIFKTGIEYPFYISLFRSVHEEIKLKKKYGAQLLGAYVTLLVTNVARLTGYSVKLRDKQKFSKECRIIIDYISNNYTNDITLEMLCGLVFLSKSHLIKIFRKETGMTPMAYLFERRILAAKTMLLTTTFTVTQISTTTGFSSPSNFIVKFKEDTGLSPLQFRKLKKQRTSK